MESLEWDSILSFLWFPVIGWSLEPHLYPPEGGGEEPGAARGFAGPHSDANLTPSGSLAHRAVDVAALPSEHGSLMKGSIERSSSIQPRRPSVTGLFFCLTPPSPVKGPSTRGLNHCQGGLLRVAPNCRLIKWSGCDLHKISDLLESGPHSSGSGSGNFSQACFLPACTSVGVCVGPGWHNWAISGNNCCNPAWCFLITTWMKPNCGFHQSKETTTGTLWFLLANFSQELN